MLIYNHFSNAYFIIQKEVAEKYIGKPKINPLYISLLPFVELKKIFDIDQHAFTPIPKVTSSLIHIKKIPNPEISILQYHNYTLNRL